MNNTEIKKRMKKLSLRKSRRLAHYGYVTESDLLEKIQNEFCFIGYRDPLHHGLNFSHLWSLTKDYNMGEFPLSKKASYMYYSWLIKRSVFRHAFKSKDVNFAVNTGVILDPDKDSKYVISAMLATRLPYEDYVGYSWHRLVSAGMDENIAYIFSHLINFSKKGERVSLMDVGFGHSNISPNISSNCLLNFLNEDMTLTGLSYNRHKSYSKINKLFGERIFGTEEVNYKLKKFKPSHSSGENTNNPFTKISQNPSYNCNEKLLSELVEHCNKIVEEIRNDSK